MNCLLVETVEVEPSKGPVWRCAMCNRPVYWHANIAGHLAHCRAGRIAPAYLMDVDCVHLGDPQTAETKACCNGTALIDIATCARFGPCSLRGETTITGTATKACISCNDQQPKG